MVIWVSRWNNKRFFSILCCVLLLFVFQSWQFSTGLAWWKLPTICIVAEKPRSTKVVHSHKIWATRNRQCMDPIRLQAKARAEISSRNEIFNLFLDSNLTYFKLRLSWIGPIFVDFHSFYASMYQWITNIKL